MAALGLTYVEMLSYTAGLLVITLFYIVWYIFGKMTEDNIVLNIAKEPINVSRLVFGASPLFIAIGLLVTGLEHWIVFLATTLYYILYSKIFNLKKINSYINWKLMAMLALIVIMSYVVVAYYDDPLAPSIKLG